MHRTGHRLLLADDSCEYRRSLRIYLELEGYQVEEASSVNEAKARLQEQVLDLVLADLRLADNDDPLDMSGLQVAGLAGELGIPSIIVTAYPSVEAAVMALRSRGLEPLAVDFVSKKDGPRAVLHAIMGVLSRAERVPRPSLSVDLQKQLVWRRGKLVRLSRQQYALLAHLFEREGAVCSTEELLKAVYDEDVPAGQASADKRIERLVARLREKIEDDPARPVHLVSEPGRGFRLVIES